MASLSRDAPSQNGNAPRGVNRRRRHIFGSVLLTLFLFIALARNRSSNLSLFSSAGRIADTANTGGNAHGPKCLVYDRPMRTGSTTTVEHLANCLGGHGWVVDHHHTGNKRPEGIEMELQRRGQMKAMVRGHKWITAADIHLLRRNCSHVAFITSTAPMWQQVWSAAKMLSNVRRNGNTTLTASEGERALDWVRTNAPNYIRMYETYPYIVLQEELKVQSDGRYPDVPPKFERDPAMRGDEWVPDYVIRKEHLHKDLPLLLRALGCDGDIGSPKNVHEVEGTGEEEFERKVKELGGMGDGVTYARLMRHARNNGKGLKTIRAMMAAKLPGMDGGK